MASDPSRRVTSEDLTHYFNSYVSLNQEDKKDSYDTAKIYIDILLQRINARDPRFDKEGVRIGSSSQGLKVGTADEFDINVKLCNLPRTHWSYDTVPKCYFEDNGPTQYTRGTYPSMAPSSIRTRRSQWRRFIKFCQIYSARPLPAKPKRVCLYIDHLHGLQHSTIRNYVGGVALLHKLNGYDPKFMRDANVRSKLGLRPFRGGVKKLQTTSNTTFGDPAVSLMNPPEDWSDLSAVNANSEKILSPQLVRQKFKSLLKDVVDESNLSEVIHIDHLCHGPAITIKILHPDLDHPIAVDFAPMIQSEAGFPYWVQWPHNDKVTTWPTREKKKAVRKLGVNLVPKGEDKWQISYSKAEKELRKGIDIDGTCRVKCHRIMKKLREDVWCKPPATKSTLTSYHLKNLLFWECERFPDGNSWTNDHLATRFNSMLSALMECLQAGALKMFMNPKVDLLEDKKRDALEKVIINISNFQENPLKYFRPDLN